jgi:DNA-binding CsgD family transcriptional regulator
MISARERDVLVRVAEGMRTDEIAREMYLSPETVKSYLKSLFWKLDARNRTHAVAVALRRGLIE